MLSKVRKTSSACQHAATNPVQYFVNSWIILEERKLMAPGDENDSGMSSQTSKADTPEKTLAIEGSEEDEVSAAQVVDLFTFIDCLGGRNPGGATVGPYRNVPEPS